MVAGVSLECILMVGYALALALIAFLLEWAGRHAHRRSQRSSTAGFTYHPEKDIWRCPQDQHLFPVFSDSVKGTVIYRAPAAACNACPSKAACTDSNHGRQIERSELGDVKYEMKRFHHAISLTLLVLASLILVVELFRTGGIGPRVILAVTLVLFWTLIQRVSAKLSEGSQYP